MTWYYIDESITDGDRRKGPYTLDEIKELVRSKKIEAETLVWHSGMENFHNWKDLEESKDPDSLPEDELLKQTIAALLEQQQKQKRYAGFFPRALAFLIDNLIISTIGFIVLQALTALQVFDLNSISQATASMQASGSDSFSEMLKTIMNDPNMEKLIIAVSVFQAFYFIIFTALRGATPGKMVMHLRVETAEGEKVTWVTSITRYIASLFTQFTLAFYGIGYLIVIIDPKRRALHDHIARSRVVVDYSIKIKESSKQEQER